MEGMHTFCLTDVVEDRYPLITETMIQRAIDGVNMAVKTYPDAWEFVRSGKLIKDEAKYAPIGNHPVEKILFTEMLKDNHTSASAVSIIKIITNLARQRGTELGLGLQ